MVRHLDIMNDASGMWIYRSSKSAHPGLYAWWRWIRLWPLPVQIRIKPYKLRKH